MIFFERAFSTYGERNIRERVYEVDPVSREVIVMKKEVCSKRLGAAVGNWVIGILLMLIVFEIMSSMALLYIYRYKYKFNSRTIKSREISRLSSINFLNLAASRLLGLKFSESKMFNKKSDPAPFMIPDDIMGYSTAPGEYTLTFLRKYPNDEAWESLKTKATINNDGSRWTGNINSENLAKIYIFGDSFVFGVGVNDEQTFSYLLQSAMPNYKIILYALGGYSLTQAYLRFENIKDEITASDIIILGYAGFFDRRHVLSPSWLKEIHSFRIQNPDLPMIYHTLPKASLDGSGAIVISYINKDCEKNNGYCEINEPGSLEMADVTAALINHISDHTKAKVYLLHFQGNYNNPMLKLINKRINLISALPEDFDYFISDNVEGFDDHPGPYWHYAISRRLLEVLGSASTNN